MKAFFKSVNLDPTLIKICEFQRAQMKSLFRKAVETKDKTTRLDQRMKVKRMKINKLIGQHKEVRERRRKMQEKLKQIYKNRQKPMSAYRTPQSIGNGTMTSIGSPAMSDRSSIFSLVTMKSAGTFFGSGGGIGSQTNFFKANAPMFQQTEFVYCCLKHFAFIHSFFFSFQSEKINSVFTAEVLPCLNSLVCTLDS